MRWKESGEAQGYYFLESWGYLVSKGIVRTSGVRIWVLGNMQGLHFRVMRLRLRAWALGFQGQGFLVSCLKARELEHP